MGKSMGAGYDGTLVLVIRGWSDPVKTPFFNTPGGGIPSPFLELLSRSLPGAELLVPQLPLGILSTADPAELVQDLLGQLDRRFAERPFRALIIVAFSAGTLLARHLYSLACGAQTQGTLDPIQARPWADRVTRLIMLAGVTRGWSISSATPAHIRFLAPVLTTLVEWWCWLRHRRPPFILQIKRGAPFVVEGRLKLLQVERSVRALPGARLPHTVSLVGSRDEYISPADAMDLGPREDFTYIEVPFSNHLQILEVDPDTASSPEAASQPSAPARLRAGLIRRALTDDPEELADLAMSHDDIDDYIDEMDRPLGQAAEAPVEIVRQVVFIVHGIRDNDFWTKRIAREIKTAGRGRALVIRAPSPSYGYFSMWDFINFWGRRDATYWFLEKYAEIRVLYPDAPISYIGHSNGTYIAANALACCAMVRLDRILFAGSVVRTDYDWTRLAGRASSVLNLVATADWVVACLPGAFQQLGLRFFGVGGAGFYGFKEPTTEQGPEVRNFRFLEGGHGVGVSEPLWRDIANYMIDGRLPPRISLSQPPGGTAPLAPDARPLRRSERQERLAKLCRLAPVAGLALLLLIVWALVSLFEGWGLVAASVALVILIENVVRFY